MIEIGTSAPQSLGHVLKDRVKVLTATLPIHQAALRATDPEAHGCNARKSSMDNAEGVWQEVVLYWRKRRMV